MDTKTFAQTARKILLTGVSEKLHYWGFEKDGTVTETPTPVGGGMMFRGEAFDDKRMIKLWQTLREEIKRKGLEQIVEETAYTWFNRIIAIRILAKNGYDASQLTYAEGSQHLPIILQKARRGTHPFLNEKDANRLRKINTDFSKEKEAFALLLVGYCRSHTLLNQVFGSINDYTELLLPDNILNEDGFLHLLNTTDAISDQDYLEVELIGWLYQFYISEKKEEISKSFKKKQKAEAKDIPAATQIFTPNWIVRYMVENTVGKIWLDLHPDSDLKVNMKYLVEGDNPEYGNPIISEVAELKLLDPAVGSGHILVEGFELLYKMYESEYYSPEEAVESILNKNLFGLDIDKRAVQLAQFAVLLKAAKYYRDVLTKGWLPNIYAMPEPRAFSRQEVLDFLGDEGVVMEEVLSKSLQLMQQAKNLGSIMQFHLGDWDFQKPEVLQFLVDRKWISPLFYDLVAEVIQELEDLAAKVETEWGKWSFSKAQVLKGIQEKPVTLESIIVQTMAIDQKASRAAITSGYSSFVKIQDVFDLPNRTESEQKETSKWFKKLMDNAKYLHQTLQKLLVQLNISSQDLKGYLAKDGLSQKQIQLAFLEKSYKSSLKRNYLLEDLTAYTQDFLFNRWRYLREKEDISFHQSVVLESASPFLQVLNVLCNKYESVVANPPYMGQKNMNASLKNYVNNKYPISKSDLFTVFMETIFNLLREDCLMGMINPQAWLFNSSYLLLRERIIKKFKIENLLDFGRGVFGPDHGTVSFVIKNKTNHIEKGIYRQLFHRREKVENLFLKNEYFLDPDFGFYEALQKDFMKIPLSPIAYWAPEKSVDLFEFEKKLAAFALPKQGLATGDNSKFLRFWHEVAFLEINMTSANRKEGKESQQKWFPCNKGGAFRKWYGNNDYIVNWKNDGEEIRSFKDANGKLRSRPQNMDFYFKEGISWSTLTISKASFRYSPQGFLFETKGSVCFPNDKADLYYILGYLNSCLVDFFLKILSPTVDYHEGPLGRIPFLIDENFTEKINKISALNLSISRKDWNSGEFSWDFQKSPLIVNTSSLKFSYTAWKKDITNTFFELHSNEEKLNQIFIEIYHIQENLTPEILLKDITILQEELDRKVLASLESTFREKGAEAIDLPIKRDIVMQQLISYAVGIMMGRYRLDLDGLHIAHPNSTDAEIQPYTYNGHQVEIDEDAIVPLMGSAGEFPDDAVQRFKEFLDIVWGADTRTENMNFLQECLDKDLEAYMVKDFWKDHCKRYKNKPIYWLFSSAKGAFQVLVYMHRMNAFTVEKIRANYLMPHLKNLRNEIAHLENNENSLSSQEARQLDKLRKSLLECESYELLIKDVADRQIVFDLDDGVTANYQLFESVVAKIK